MAAINPCNVHNDPRHWVESSQQPYKDRTRIECRRCGRLIGYRVKSEKAKP